MVEFDPHVDQLSQAILDIKFHYLIQPISKSMHEYSCSLGSYIVILANALLLSATLTRDFSSEGDAFIPNFATGLILSTAQTWNELAYCLIALGFTTSNVCFSES